MNNSLLKITFVSGLEQIVREELSGLSVRIVNEGKDSLYLEPFTDFQTLRALRSVANVYLVKRGSDLHPLFLVKHKSVLGELIEFVLKSSNDKFKTFKLGCAGAQSKEVREIEKYIKNTYNVVVAEDADLEVYIGKQGGLWEIGVRISARPLTLRDYKIENIKGGMNPTIAYAMNTFCDLSSISSYLNVFSGSATLLIEAGLTNPALKLVGFDSNGKTNAAAVVNIKKAGLVKKIHLKTANIFDTPDMGTFDCIASDLPFGMQISKDEDLEKLYTTFLEYCAGALNPSGTLLIYTAAHAVLEPLIPQAGFTIDTQISLTIPTSVKSYLHPKIFVCKLV